MPNILVVDDDPVLLATSRMVLDGAGHGVTVADCATAALSSLRAVPFDLVFADLKLPDFSGLDLLRLVRGDENPVPFVIVTGFGSSSAAVAAMKLGATDFIEKPVYADGLIRLAKKYAGGQPGSFPSCPVEAGRAVVHTQMHAAVRWARVVLCVVDAPADPRTLADWARLAGASVGALRNWCRIAWVPARRSLLFARLLRAVVLAQREGWYPEQFLDTVDPRTLTRLLRLGGLPLSADSRPRPTTESYLAGQALIAEPHALLALERALRVRDDAGDADARSRSRA